MDHQEVSVSAAEPLTRQNECFCRHPTRLTADADADVRTNTIERAPRTGRDEEMGRGNVTNQELADLVEQTREAASAFIRGDIRRYLTLIRHADDYTLMAPSGGEPRRGFDASDQAVEALAEYFRGGGEAELQVFESYTSGDLVVLVAVERQHGEVGGRPDQDWSLRVTLVFRREGPGWRLAHRHADPLVHEITMEQLASIAGG
jgi:ketosteroid isomerase-like protein